MVTQPLYPLMIVCYYFLGQDIKSLDVSYGHPASYPMMIVCHYFLGQDIKSLDMSYGHPASLSNDDSLLFFRSGY